MVTIKLSNGNSITYFDYGSLYIPVSMTYDDGKTEEYNIDTCLINALDYFYKSRKRVRIWYGDTETGKDWYEQFNIVGRIGRTCGDIHEPILVYNKKSLGGLSILVKNIIRIDSIEDHEIFWKCKNYRIPEYTIESFEEGKYDVYADENLIANFSTENKAKRFIDFMTGKRYNK